MAEVNYESRVVLFLDILGFKKHVTDTVDKEGNDVSDEIKKLNDALVKMGNIAFDFGNKSHQRMVTQFSDSIVISFTNVASPTFIQTFDVIIRIMISLLQDGIICRGGLSYGKLVHTERIVFGPAMVEAYETESKAAMYPRVIMDRKIYDLGRMYTDNEHQRLVIPENLTDYIAFDFDGRYYLDFLNAARHVLTSTEELLEYFDIIRDIIVKGSRFQQPDLKVKYGYLKAKYNDFLKQFKVDDEAKMLAVARYYHPKVFSYLRNQKLLKFY